MRKGIKMWEWNGHKRSGTDVQKRNEKDRKQIRESIDKIEEEVK